MSRMFDRKSVLRNILVQHGCLALQQCWMLDRSFSRGAVTTFFHPFSNPERRCLWIFHLSVRLLFVYLFTCFKFISFKATAEKLKCQKEAEQTAMTIELANRLVGGLASENVRWAESVANFKEQEKTLPGDVLLTTAFVSYMGCFTRKYRDNLMNVKWLPFLKGQSVCNGKLHLMPKVN